MKCPNDGSEMEKGALKTSMIWSLENFITKLDKMITSNYVYAYKCPKCGKIELKTEVK